MSSETEASVKIVADASGVAPVLEGVKEQIRELTLSVHESVEGFNAFKASLVEIGEVYMAAFAVDWFKEFSAEMGEAAEHIKHLADEFGLSAAQVQKLQGVALGTGVSVDTLVRGMALLDKTTATMSGAASAAGKALAIVGISAGDGRSQMERLAVVADKFASMSAGPERLALAMELFGKNGREMLPILEQGSKGIEEMSAKAEKLGMVNTNAAAKGLKLAESVNEGRMAWAGLQTTLEDAFAPLLIGITEGFEHLTQKMVESYNRGGIVHDIFDDITTAATEMGNALRVVGDVIATVRSNLDTIIPVAGAFATMIAGRYVTGMAAALLSTTELRFALIGLVGTFELGGSVAAFQLLISGLAGAMTGLAAAAAEATIALLANPMTWLAAGVAGLIATYREWTSVTQEQTTATNDLHNAGETLANTEESLAGKSKEALEQMKAETAVALDLARAHLKVAEAALTQAKAEEAIASKNVGDANSMSLADPSSQGGPAIAAGIMDLFAEHKVAKQTQAYHEQKKAVEDLSESIAKLDAAIATAKPATTDLGLSHTQNEKKPKDDTVQLLEQELTAKKMAWDLEQDAQNTAQQFSLESEKQFWAAALEQTNLSAKDRGEIEKKYLEASSRLRTQQIAGQIDLYKQEEAVAGKNADAKLAVVQRETAYIERMYGQASDHYRAAATKEVEATKAAEQQKLDLARVTTDSLIKLSQLKVAGEEADDKFLVDMGLKSQAAALANGKKYQTELHAIEMEGLQQRLTLMKKDPNHDPVAYKQLTDQIAQAEQAFQNKMTGIDQKGALDRSKLAHQIYAPFAQEIGHLISLHQSFFTTLHNMWSNFGNMVDQAISRMVENWLVALATQEVASAKMHMTEVVHHAKAGAAAAYHAMVGIPVIGPIIAPAAAAVAFAGIMAFSAEGGMGTVPYDNAPFLLHKNEMVLPANLATPLRSMLTTPAANNNSPMPANDGPSGDTHFHLTFNGPTNKREIERFFMDNKHGLAAAAKAAVRHNSPTL